MSFVIAMSGQDDMRPYGELFKQRGFDIRYIQSDIKTEAQCVEALRGFDGVVALGEPINDRTLDALPDLKLVARFGLGYDKVDLAAAERHGVCVTNTAGTMAGGVAETSLLLMLEAARRFAKYDKAVHAGIWSRNYRGTQLEGKTVGIIGFGSIGRRLAQYLQGFHCRILVHDLRYDEAQLQALNAEPSELMDLAAQADFVSVNCPLTPETRGIISEAFLSRMKPSAYLVNTSRGPTVDQAALIAALQAGKIAGAGLDVYEREPLEDGSPLRGMENVVLLPHIASLTGESMLECAEDVAKTLEAFAAGQVPAHCLNPGYVKSARH